MDIPFGPVGYLVYKRTYARPLGKGKSEEFEQTIKRIVDASNKQLKVGFSIEEKKRLTEILTQLKGSVAGRFMWQLGTRTVKDLGLASLQNCAFTVVDDPIKPFTWTMDMLMLGSGVGYNIQRKHIYGLPKVINKRINIERRDTNDADFIVPDSREGWVRLLEYTLESHFRTGTNFTYSTRCIRGKGSEIKGFGGIASGPEELCWGIGEINRLLNDRRGKKLRSIDCLDIMNIIGYIVVAGNVRRSAQIAIGDYDDKQFLAAKNWGSGSIPNWRAMSNNSVVCNDISKLPIEFWNSYNGEGEPYGLINLSMARSVGRTGEREYPDSNVQGFNPCAEQSLEPFETCCLSEIHLPNIESKEELAEVATYLYRINKHSLLLPCHHKETEAIVHKNMRMGIGITGYCQATKEQKSWLSDTYIKIRNFDKAYSKSLGIPESIKLTTVKPSGTLSLLSGVTSGAHPGYSKYYIRRIRMAANSSLVDVCKANGYDVEFQKRFDGSDDHETVVVSFPCEHPDHTILAKDVSAIEQMEIIKKLQAEWSDNAVSVTIYYKPEELDGIKEWLNENYDKSIKTISFLLHSEHNFVQAPLEEITEREYQKIKARTKPVKHVEIKEKDLEIEECASGHCPIK